MCHARPGAKTDLLAHSILAAAPHPAQQEERATSIGTTRKSPGRGLFFVLSGPAGAGKDRVLNELRGVEPFVHFAVTATTRPPRPGEIDGSDYYFMTDMELRKLMADGELLEHAEVYGRLYG